MIRNKLMISVLGGVMAVGLLGSTAVSFAQTDLPATTSAASLVLIHNGGLGGLSDRDQSLADALGIDLEALQTAQQAARIAMIDQAVADGLLTEAQGEQMKLLGGGFGRGGRFGYDEDQYLADALGISVEELQAAELSSYATELAAAVEAGTITQDEADLMLARRAVQNYVDQDALNSAAQAVHEDALAAAVADGAITQAQADALLAQFATQSFGFGPHDGFGGHGGRGGRGGPGGFGLNSLPNSTPQTTPDTTTDTSFDA
ncbi:MAG: hypothetical protein KIS95_04210 [Anaerolineae bacterium]|uniref:hypothetical protein n=1 Tax=Promineifilum sp. TaxID=2664178 RepID=UPI001D2E8DDE|nr:hypothetical protein [Anaerolineales bacterium]MCB8936029.1 hypothetical protein [Promineifilum sp.]MCO5181913.1 hypothetical protein [Promineifilum sp.]MCW5846410.1 hypothetical protein [Anaerolineae bacterium]